jgi:hypothetical protein
LSTKLNRKNKSAHIKSEVYKKEFEDTEEVIRIRKSKKDRQQMAKGKKDTMIYKTYT